VKKIRDPSSIGCAVGLQDRLLPNSSWPSSFLAKSPGHQRWPARYYRALVISSFPVSRSVLEKKENNVCKALRESSTGETWSTSSKLFKGKPTR
jgi:hypothetical protein